MTSGWLDGLTISEETSLSLLSRAQQGDAIALEALMGRYRARLHGHRAEFPPERAPCSIPTMSCRTRS